MTLTAFAAERGRLQQIPIDCKCPRSAANQPHALLLPLDGTDRQTDGRSPDRYVNAASRTKTRYTTVDTMLEIYKSLFAETR